MAKIFPRVRHNFYMQCLALIFFAPLLIFALVRVCGLMSLSAEELYDDMHLLVYSLILIALSLLEIFLQHFSAGKGDIMTLRELENRSLIVRPLLDSLIMFVNTALTFFIALPLGQEGPSVFLIASFCIFLFKGDKKHEPDYDEAIDFGAGIGYGLAFYNPFAGVAFCYEAMHRPFKWKRFLLICGLMAASYLMLLTYGFLFDGWTTGVWDFSFQPPHYRTGLTFMNAWEEWVPLIILSLLIMIGVFLFNKYASLIRPLFASRSVQALLFSFLVSVVLICEARAATFDSFMGHSLLGSGAYFLDNAHDMEWQMALYALMVRFIFSGLAFSFPHAGGQAIPTLAIGALLGISVAKLVNLTLPLSANAIVIYLLAGALAFYALSTQYIITTLFLSLAFGNPLMLMLPLLIVMLPGAILTHFAEFESLEHSLKKADKKAFDFAKSLYLAHR